ncbi:Glutathione transferase [Bertholletia excelsa]
MAAARKLYGVVGATPTLRALASLFEHDLEFEFVAIEHLQDHLFSLSPFGQLPIYQDGDMTLFGSRAIMRGISHTYLHPQQDQIYMKPKLQGLASTWIDVEDHHFDPLASWLVSELVFKPRRGEPVDETAVAEAEAKLASVLDVYEERLGASEYLGGDKFTSADLTHLPHLYYLMRTPVKRLFDERRRVGEWCARIMDRPAWAKVVEMVEAAHQK